MHGIMGQRTPHHHNYTSASAQKYGGRSVRRQCATCPAWDDWRTIREARPDLTPPAKRVDLCHGFDTPGEIETLGEGDMHDLMIATADALAPTGVTKVTYKDDEKIERTAQVVEQHFDEAKKIEEYRTMYSKLSMDDLRVEAANAKIPGRSKMKKYELIDALAEHDAKCSTNK